MVTAQTAASGGRQYPAYMADVLGIADVVPASGAARYRTLIYRKVRISRCKIVIKIA